MSERLPWTRQVRAGWGRTTTAMVPVYRPASIEELRAALHQSAPGSVLAIGSGRSYGDNAINSSGVAVSTAGLNRIISFDRSSGELVCEAGVRYCDLLDRFLPEGFVVPVSPGTGFVTIGGAIANDVHGKNHDRQGSLGRYVNWIELICADGSVLRTSAREDPDLFYATIGGIGLTGIISRASITMKPLGGSSMIVRECRVAHLDDFLERLSFVRTTTSYSVGWIDALQRGRNLGRGILETAEPAEIRVERHRARSLSVPFDLPQRLMNRYAVAAFNSVYFRRVPRAGRERVMTYDRFTYPLDTIRDWNRAYGRRGFYQFQCVLPDEAASQGLKVILETVVESGRASFLAVLKTLGDAGEGYLSFPRRGYTLALDIPRRRGSRELMRTLHSVALDHGGRVYLAKDALLREEEFREMYPKNVLFTQVLDRVDPQRRFQSDMARRLGLV